MDTKQLNDALAKLFVDAGERIVFWHDPAHEFIDFMNRLPFLTFDHTTVQIIRLDEVGALEAKIRLERDEPEGQVPALRPDRRTRLRRRLAARHPALQPQLPGGSRPSILLQELGLVNQHLRDTSCRPPQVLRRQGPAPEDQESGRPGRRRRRPGSQDDRRGRQGRPAGTVQLWCGRSSTPGPKPAEDEIDLDNPPAVLGPDREVRPRRSRSGRW